MIKKMLLLLSVLTLWVSSLPLPVWGAAPQRAEGIVLSADGSHYTYTLPETAPAHDYHREAFSTSHEFRDIYLTQFGQDKAVVYDMAAHVMLLAFYDDTLDYAKEIRVSGFEQIATVSEMGAARLAVERDMPLLQTFVSFRGGGSGYDYECVLAREVSNYFSDECPTDNAGYIATRDRVLAELRDYRRAVEGIEDDEEKLELVGRLFDDGAVYDKGAPYHPIYAMLHRRGVCGGANLAFVMIGNAVGVPSFYLGVPGANHAVTLVKPNGGELKVIDVTFGIRNPRVQAISGWKHRDRMTWDNDVLRFKNEYYYPDVNIVEHLGGLS